MTKNSENVAGNGFSAIGYCKMRDVSLSHLEKQLVIGLQIELRKTDPI